MRNAHCLVTYFKFPSCSWLICVNRQYCTVLYRFLVSVQYCMGPMPPEAERRSAGRLGGKGIWHTRQRAAATRSTSTVQRTAGAAEAAARPLFRWF